SGAQTGRGGGAGPVGGLLGGKDPTGRSSSPPSPSPTAGRGSASVSADGGEGSRHRGRGGNELFLRKSLSEGPLGKFVSAPPAHPLPLARGQGNQSPRFGIRPILLTTSGMAAPPAV